jgi:hypothetical protein
MCLKDEETVPSCVIRQHLYDNRVITSGICSVELL